MRALPAAIVASAMAHAAIAVVVVWRAPGAAIAVAPTALPAGPPPPVEFELLDPPAVAAATERVPAQGASGIARAATRTVPGGAATSPGRPSAGSRPRRRRARNAVAT